MCEQTGAKLTHAFVSLGLSERPKPFKNVPLIPRVDELNTESCLAVR